jgi:MFS family permease
LALITASAGPLNELLIYHFLTGLGLGGARPNIIALTGEYAPARMRAMLIGVMFCGFPMGSMLGGVISAALIGTFGWLVAGVDPLPCRARRSRRADRAHLALLNPAVPQEAGSRYVGWTRT